MRCNADAATLVQLPDGHDQATIAIRRGRGGSKRRSLPGRSSISVGPRRTRAAPVGRKRARWRCRHPPAAVLRQSNRGACSNMRLLSPQDYADGRTVQAGVALRFALDRAARPRRGELVTRRRAELSRDAAKATSSSPCSRCNIGRSGQLKSNLILNSSDPLTRGSPARFIREPNKRIMK